MFKFGNAWSVEMARSVSDACSQQTLHARVRKALGLVSPVPKSRVPWNATVGSRDNPETSAPLRKIGREGMTR